MSAPTEGAANVKSGLRAQPLAKSAAARDAFEGRLCGEIRDSGGRPLRFATVALLKRGVLDQTDEHGRFCVHAAPGRDSVVVTLLGFQTLRTQVNISDQSDELTLTLEPVGLTRSSRTLAATTRAAAPSAAAAQPDPETMVKALPDSLRQVAEYAQRLTGVAERSGDAKQYEAAAAQWERLLVSVAGSPLEIHTRGRIAEMRYLAWEAEPGQRSAQKAREALTAFLVRAPIGPERNRATLWLDKVAQ